MIVTFFSIFNSDTATIVQKHAPLNIVTDQCSIFSSAH